MTNNEEFKENLNEKSDVRLVINIAQQTLTLYKHNKQMTQSTVSTAKNGIGSQQANGCSPLGKHVIAAKIGGSEPMNAVFVGRKPTGEVYSAELGKLHTERDWILSRILWLSGLEEGLNKGSNAHGDCDTYQRYIYIH